MKRKLLYFTCLITGFAFAQAPINNFNSAPNSMYATVTTTPAVLDESASGPSAVWNFTSLTSTGTATDTYAAPDGAQIATYPGTTSVFTTTQDSSGDATNIFGKQAGSEVSLTGAEGAEFTLNYDDDNALIGNFPLTYTSNTTDAIGGSYVYNGDAATISGDFTGSIVVTVDAYGTLNMNDVGVGAYSDAVTRLKIVQTANLSIPPFIPNAGTATQTSYYYYDDANGNLVFRSNSVHLQVPLFAIDETTNIYESLLTNLLSVNEQVTNELSIVPNPVSDVLSIKLKSSQTVKSVTISDLSGRQVLNNVSNETAINVSHLQAGVYILMLEIDTEILTHKFVKN